jgi:hypothetical protein
MTRLRVAATAFAVVLSSVLATMTAAPALALQICDQYGTTTVAGRYAVQNNRWGASTPQCITTTATGFIVSQSDANQANSGAPASYPSIFYGWHYGNSSPGTIFPIQANSSAFGAVSTSVSMTYPTTGVWDAAYDIWFDPTARTNGQNTGAEVMIWLNHTGSVQPVGSKVATVSLAGATWDVWEGNIGWNVISYVRQAPTTTMNFPVSTFYTDAIGRGYAQSAWYLTSIQAGFEPWVGGTGLAVDNFSVTTSGGTPAATAPAPVPATTAPATVPAATPPATVPATSPAGSVGCAATYEVLGEWPGGFEGEVTVHNDGAAPVAGWTVSGTLAAGQTITQSWATALTTSGSHLSAANLSWNGTIGAGASTTFGFIGAGPSTAPALSCAAK